MPFEVDQRVQGQARLAQLERALALGRDDLGAGPGLDERPGIALVIDLGCPGA